MDKERLQQARQLWRDFDKLLDRTDISDRGQRNALVSAYYEACAYTREKYCNEHAAEVGGQPTLDDACRSCAAFESCSSGAAAARNEFMWQLIHQTNPSGATCDAKKQKLRADVGAWEAACHTILERIR